MPTLTEITDAKQDLKEAATAEQRGINYRDAKRRLNKVRTDLHSTLTAAKRVGSLDAAITAANLTAEEAQEILS